jgi:hypothetical protein
MAAAPATADPAAARAVASELVATVLTGVLAGVVAAVLAAVVPGTRRGVHELGWAILKGSSIRWSATASSPTLHQRSPAHAYC